MEKTKKPLVLLHEYSIPNSFEFVNFLHLNGDWTVEKFKQNFQIKIVNESDNKYELEFDLIGCSAALANAFRRILLSEVPSMAIDKVYMYINTSLIQDEVLAHRLGLIPLKADPRLFEYPSRPAVSNTADLDEVSDQDTLRYELKVTCRWNQQAPKDARRPDDIYIGNNVYSRDIKWQPVGQQRELYPKGDKQFGMIEDDILVCKMRPYQEIHAVMDAVKGIGKDHAKFSPVSTATYRLLPYIKILRPVRGKNAERLKSCFSPGVIEVVDTSEGPEARVKNARYDSCSRNVFRHDDLKDCVQIGRVPDHFIFTVESVGALPSATLFIEAVKVLKEKCKTFIEELDNIEQ